MKKKSKPQKKAVTAAEERELDHELPPNMQAEHITGPTTLKREKDE